MFWCYIIKVLYSIILVLRRGNFVLIVDQISETESKTSAKEGEFQKNQGKNRLDYLLEFASGFILHFDIIPQNNNISLTIPTSLQNSDSLSDKTAIGLSLLQNKVINLEATEVTRLSDNVNASIHFCSVSFTSSR